MRLGISSYAYAWAIGVPGNEPAKPLDAFGLLEKAVELKVSCVQIADNLPLHILDTGKRRQLLKYAGDNGINIEVGIRGLTDENLSKYIDLAEYFRSPVLRAVIDTDNFRPDIPSVIGIVKNWLPEFSARNISLAIENHDRFTAAEFARIIESAGDVHAGICLDSVNSMGAGEGMDEVLRILGPYTINFHIKDFIVKRVSHMMGFVVEGAVAGTGMLPLQDILDKLHKWGQCDSGQLESWVPPGRSIDETIDLENKWAIESIRNLRPFFTE